MTMSALWKSRSANYNKILIYSFLSVLVLALVTGCSPERSGLALENQAPKVYIVNTPPDGAQFSRNPQLDWYATDIDGFVSFFRHAVVVESLLVVNGQHVSVDDFINQAADNQFGWETLLVSLDNPQSTATIRLYADVVNPVDSFVNQYFFIQAQDNEGAMSEVVWRRYSRNNHYPNTHHRSSQVYINAKDENSPSDGITLTYSGADSTDYGRATPPLEFEWRLFGPFLDTSSIFVDIVEENCTWDPTGDSFTNCAEALVVNLAALPPVVGNLPQPLTRSRGPNYNQDTTDVWVTDQQVTVYDVFSDLGTLEETSQFKFIFWVRARDDGFVPDPTPAFSQFLVLEALFERDVAVHDETYYYIRAGRWGPKNIIDVRGVFLNYINNTLEDIYGGSYIPFDTLSRFDYLVIRDSLPPDTITDYFSLSPRMSEYPVPGWTWYGAIKPTMVDLLSHKLHIFYNDDAMGGPVQEEGFGLLTEVYFAMDMGASGWFMGRNLANVNEQTGAGFFELSTDFAAHFGLTSVYHEGWLYEFLGRIGRRLPPKHNQEYVGCLSLVPSIFPDVSIDLNLLRQRYLQLDRRTYYPPDPLVDTLVLNGFPDVGSGTKAPGTAAVYLYQSKDGAISRLNGQVMGVAMDAENYRSATMLFTPIATDSVQTQAMFDQVMPWLMDKWLNPQVAAKASPGITVKSDVNASYNQNHQNVRRFIERVEKEALVYPEILNELNIYIRPPIVKDRYRVDD